MRNVFPRSWSFMPVMCAGLLLGACSGGPFSGDAMSAADSVERPGWKLVWQDEFNGPEIDTASWIMEGGGLGWGNAEMQFYTGRPENARIENGRLVIEAHEERLDLNDYTSARMKTQGLREFTYGRFEARMRLPVGKGLWPAFWLLGADYKGGNWPECGEIDIMESVGSHPDYVLGTVHGPGYSGGRGISQRHFFEKGDVTQFRVYAVEWDKDQIRWYVDGEMFHRVTPTDLPGRWVYDHPFFIILNLAVGGHLPGEPDENTVFPARMEVDYVRVYQRP